MAGHGTAFLCETTVDAPPAPLRRAAARRNLSSPGLAPGFLTASILAGYFAFYAGLA